MFISIVVKTLSKILKLTPMGYAAKPHLPALDREEGSAALGNLVSEK